jgi:HEAT repeat protein
MENNDKEQQFTPGPDLYNGHTSSSNNLDASAPFVALTLAHLGLSKAKNSPTKQNDQLRAALNDPVWSVRIAAVQTMETMGEQAPIDLLLSSLKNENSSVRAVAARVLGKLGEHAPVEPLVAALRDAEWYVRATSAQALGKLRGRIPVAALIEVLDDEDEAVRAGAVWALGEAGEQAPLEPLVTALNDPAWSVREAAVLALSELGERVPEMPLVTAQLDEDASVRESASLVLTQGNLETSQPTISTQISTRQEDQISRPEVRDTMGVDKHLSQRSIKHPRQLETKYKQRNASRRRVLTIPSPFKHFVEKVLVALVIVGLVASWLLVAHLPRTTTSGTQVIPPALIYHSYLGSIYGGVYKVAWSPDGTEIASVNVDGSVRVWNAISGKTITTYTSPVNFVKVLSMVWLPGDDVLILSERADNTIDAWNPTTDKISLSMNLPAAIYTGAWSPDGKRIAFDGGDQTIQVWNIFPTKRRISTYPVHTSERITALRWSPDGAEIASATYNGVIQLWNAVTGKNSLLPYTHAGQVVSLAWSQNSSYLAWATSDGVLQIWNKNPRNNPITLRDSGGTIMPAVALTWSPDGVYLAASNNEFVQVWNATTGKLVFTYRGHSDGVNDVAWSPDGSKVASASLDKTVQVWQIS